MNFKWEDRKDLDAILAHRQELLARSEENRETLAQGCKGLNKPIGAVVYTYRGFLFVKRNPVLVGLAAAMVTKIGLTTFTGIFSSGKKSKKSKPSRFSKFSTWAGRLGTAITIARQARHYYHQFQAQRQANMAQGQAQAQGPVE